jgi:drug/metabolite transporter (DMT)-like permease
MPTAGIEPGHRAGMQAAAGAGWALVSALLFGATFVIYGYADGVSSVMAAAWGRATGLLVYLPFALLWVRLSMPRRLMARAGAAACLDSIGYVAIAQALVLGPVAVASALSSQFATVALLLGLIVLGERPTRVQLLGLVCTITAVVLFALGG